MWKEAEDGDKCDRDRMLGKVRRIYGGGGGGGGGWERDWEFGWAEKKGEQLKPQGDSRFGWGPIGGVSQNGGRRGEENDEGKRGVQKGK